MEQGDVPWFSIVISHWDVPQPARRVKLNTKAIGQAFRGVNMVVPLELICVEKAALSWDARQNRTIQSARSNHADRSLLSYAFRDAEKTSGNNTGDQSTNQCMRPPGLVDSSQHLGDGGSNDHGENDSAGGKRPLSCLHGN